MNPWRWIRMKFMHRHALASNEVGEKFDEMLDAEREAAAAAAEKAARQRNQAREIRERSWYLHGQFEHARTTDHISEWLFQELQRETEG